MKKVLIIGGGAAGMIAAIIAARKGHKVELFEKNNKLGKKLYITGKGRCNITNNCDMEQLFEMVISNPKFLYSAFYTFSNDFTIQFFNELGLKTKVERGGRVFPNSDKSSDVIKVLEQEMRKLKATIRLKSQVKSIQYQNDLFDSIKLFDDTIVKGDALIIATGGLSYPSTGSTGDGYKFARSLGHKITKTYPALVPINIKEKWVTSLQGLSLKNVKINIKYNEKEIYSDLGEMLFTHFGVSGPLILTASRYIIPYIEKPLTLTIDLKPALDIETLDKRILRDFQELSNKQFKNALNKLLPQKIIPIIISKSEISLDKKVSEITKKERERLVTCLKKLTCTISGIRRFNEAIITCGGINVNDVDPSTMASKKIKNVYFAGEVLDLDALTGGYNLQIAWSTGYLAAFSI